MSNSFKVITRIRPCLTQEIESGYKEIVESLEENKIIIADKEVYHFDKV